MIELVAAGAALASRALLQAADAALTAVGEDELREAHGTPRRVRWVLSMKRDPEPTAAALRAAASGLLATAAKARSPLARRVRWGLSMKRDPEPTAAALRAAASGPLAFAAAA